MTEISVMIMCPWLSYLLAGSFQLSGIVSILTNGAFLSYFAQPNISIQAKKVLSTIYEAAAHSAETIVFLYLGIGFFAFDKKYFAKISWGFFLSTIVNLNVARALNIGIVSWMSNLARPNHKLTIKMQFVMWFSGLRGAMAYAIALKAAEELPNAGP